MSTPPGLSLPDELAWIAGESQVFADPASPFTAAVIPGAPRLAVVLGDNASGKSLLFRVLGLRARGAGAVAVTVSIRERTGAGSDVGGMRRVMMFGDEAEQSTGATSVQVIRTAFRQLDKPQGTLLGLDEPELGLSDGYARALGEYVGVQAQQVPAGCSGVLVVTHSRPLVHGLMAGYGQTPTVVFTTAAGPMPASLGEWLAGDRPRSVTELLALTEDGLSRWRAVNALLSSDA